MQKSTWQHKPMQWAGRGKNIKGNKTQLRSLQRNWTYRWHTNAIFQRSDDVFDLSMNPLLHWSLPQTEVPQCHQSKATMLPPVGAIICQNHSYNRCSNKKRVRAHWTIIFSKYHCPAWLLMFYFRAHLLSSFLKKCNWCSFSSLLDICIFSI